MPIYSENFTKLDSINLGDKVTLVGYINLPKGIHSDIRRVWIPGQNTFQDISEEGEFTLNNVYPGQNTLLIQFGNIINSLTLSLPNTFPHEYEEVNLPLIHWVHNKEQSFMPFAIYTDSDKHIYQTYPTLEGLEELAYSENISELDIINSNTIDYFFYESRKNKKAMNLVKDSIQSHQNIQSQLVLLIQAEGKWLAIDSEEEDYEIEGPLLDELDEGLLKKRDIFTSHHQQSRRINQPYTSRGS